MTDTHPYARGGGSTRSRWVTTAGIGLLGGPLLAGWMLLPVASAVPAEKVQICHATGSVSNPYIVTQVDVSSIDEEGNKFLNGHGDHTGPVFDPNDPQDSWGDIIPPIINPDTGATFPGLNWPAGEAIWLNGCKVPSPSPTPTETSPTPTETSPTPTETSPTPTETSPTPTETSPTPTETSPVPTVTVTVTATQVVVVPGPGVTTTVTATPTPTSPTPTETTVSPSPGTTSPTATETSPTPTESSPTPTETTVSPSPGTTTPTPTETTASPTTGTPTTTLSPSPGVTVTGTGLPTGVAAGGGPMPPIPGMSDPLRPPVLWAASAGLTAMGLLALARVRRLN